MLEEPGRLPGRLAVWRALVVLLRPSGFTLTFLVVPLLAAGVVAVAETGWVVRLVAAIVIGLFIAGLRRRPGVKDLVLTSPDEPVAISSLTGLGTEAARTAIAPLGIRDGHALGDICDCPRRSGGPRAPPTTRTTYGPM